MPRVFSNPFQVQNLLDIVSAQPGDPETWFALADELEYLGFEKEARVARLTTQMVYYEADVDGGDPPDLFERWQREQQDLLNAGAVPVLPRWTNSFGMQFVQIPPGTFMMGSPPDEPERSDNEGPQHPVEITKDFYMGIYPVTQSEYEAVMGRNPSYFSAAGQGKERVAGMDTRGFPVEYVSWHDASEFCKKLTEMDESLPEGWEYRLPTEAEWEYACRAGTTTPFHFGSTLSSYQANFNGDHPYGDAPKGPYLKRTCEVGSYKCNGWGLYDMHGNVWEWCLDWYDPNFYQACLDEANARKAQMEKEAAAAAKKAAAPSSRPKRTGRKK